MSFCGWLVILMSNQTTVEGMAELWLSRRLTPLTNIPWIKVSLSEYLKCSYCPVNFTPSQNHMSVLNLYKPHYVFSRALFHKYKLSKSQNKWNNSEQLNLKE